MAFFKNPSAAGKSSQRVQSERRMSLPSLDYPPIRNPEELAGVISAQFGNRTTVVYLYPLKRGRRDRYRAVLNGKPWKDKASLTWVFAELRGMV